VRALVFLDHIGRQSPVLSDIEALFFCPGADGTAPLAAGRSPGRAPVRAHWAGMLDERGQLAAEAPGMLGVQVNLKVLAVQPERNRLVSRTACQIVHELSLDSLHSLPPEM
jgi:hypothetical protein